MSTSLTLIMFVNVLSLGVFFILKIYILTDFHSGIVTKNVTNENLDMWDCVQLTSFQTNGKSKGKPLSDVILYSLLNYDY